MTAYLKNNAPVDLDGFTRAALEPAHSVVVRACAGSGKTWLLTSRIIRLLIAGVNPKHILAITFTKKAAQEMRDRVAQLLREMADGTPEQVVGLLTMRGLSAAQATESVARAQSLYDEILGAGQELPIHTFDAWFYRLLKAAPMGSGGDLQIARDASLLTDADDLRESAWQGFFEFFNHADGVSIRTHYLNLIERMGAFNTEKMLNSALYLSNEFELWLSHVGGTVADGLLALQDEILTETGLDVSIGAAGIAQNAHQAMVKSGALAVLVRSLDAGDEKKIARAQHIQTALDSNDADKFWQVLNQYIAASTGHLNGTNFKLEKKQKATMQGAGISEDDYAQAVDTINAHLDTVRMQHADLSAYQVHEDMLPCVFALLEHYRAHKRSANVVEFADVSRQGFELLNSVETAAFMQTQLDARYRHLLFDEFQDTNPVQWGIIHGWLSAYQGDADKPCVFLVGDVKQSIYRFRDADSTLFTTAQDYLVDEFGATVLQTQFTRRNSPAVVAWVNRMFGRADSQLDDFIAHSTAQTEMVGHIACLGLVKADDAANNENEMVEIPARDWLREPAQVIELTRHDDESAQLVQAIRSLVGQYPVWDEKTETYRPAQYADMMILIYGRTHLASYERLLRQAQIPYESTRRGGLMDTLEALDLMALLKWLLRADDDSALIQVLRAPMFAVDDAQLLQLLAHKKQLEQTHSSEYSYWQTLTNYAQSNTAWRSTYELLNEWLQMAGHAPPHDVLDRIYAQGDVYHAYARVVPTWLNPQVQANLRGFLQLALNVNSGRYPSLAGLLHALERWQARDADGVSEGEPLGMHNAVKILTVHASKGLESPIVMLIDMRTSKKPDLKGNQWFINRKGGAVPEHLSWLGNQSERGRWRAAAIAHESELNAKEHYNKCYVAMTRAKQMLLVSAAQEMDIQRDEEGKAESSKPSQKMDGLFEVLHEESLVLDAHLPDQIEQWGALWAAHWQAHPLQAIETVQGAASNLFESEIITVSDIAPNEQGLARWRNAVEIASVNEYDEQATQMGLALHSALEWATHSNAPQIISADLLMARCELNQMQAQTVAQWVDELMQHPAHQKWFDQKLYDEAHNEMALVDSEGKVKRIDRWVRHGACITVIDYKSAWADENLPAYEAQVREYLQLMRQVYPECTVQGLLLRVDGVAHIVT